MYTLTDKQIDRILNDISARGIAMEDLRQNLLDHICCIIEQNLEENGDFESFYQKTIKTFYKDGLWEIEEETLSLLLFKNYYTMKKAMIISGIISAATVTTGIVFKFNGWPGTTMFLVLGVLFTSLFFLPLFFILKIKEKQQAKDKIVLAIGSVAAISISLASIFKLMYWPGANFLGILAIVVMLAVFIPVYFFTGIRQPESKMNTIISSLLLIVGCGLFLSMIRPPRGTKIRNTLLTSAYLRSELLVRNELRQCRAQQAGDTAGPGSAALGEAIIKSCEEIKTMILVNETGYASIPEDFESKGIFISEGRLGDNAGIDNKIAVLSSYIERYNAENLNIKGHVLQAVPVKASILDIGAEKKEDKVPGALQDLNQIELFVLQNNRSLLTTK